MEQADTPSDDDDPEMVQITLRLSETFLADIDATWKKEGYNSRSEFLRYVARDAVRHPEFSREAWKQITASEHDLRTGNMDLISREVVKKLMETEDEGC